MTSRLILAICSMLLLGACGSSNWEGLPPIMLTDISPIGLDITDEGIWLSDGDRNKLTLVSLEGDSLKSITSLERPMHIEVEKGVIYVPSYGIDAILAIDQTVDTVEVVEQMDAPAGVSVSGDDIAIADFYNHRILYKIEGNWGVIGGPKKGKGDGEFDYPTDVQIFGDKIFVADAYNHRGQIFDLTGKHLLTFGADLEINAATGLFVNEEFIVLTDFENDRVMAFNHQGEVQQILSEGFFKPTDALIQDGILYVTNYKGGYISRFEIK